MRTPHPTRPIFQRDIIRAPVRVRQAPPQLTLGWIWSGIVAPTSTVEWPDQQPTDNATFVSLAVHVDVGDSFYAYIIDLLVGSSIAATLTLPQSAPIAQTDASTSEFTFSGVPLGVPLRPRIRAVPFGWAFDMTVTLTYSI